MYGLFLRLVKAFRKSGYLPSYRLTVLPSLVIVSTLSGQSVDERRQIDAFRDTLQMVTDTMALRERQALILRAAARSRSEPFFHLYLGTLSLRLGELGGAPHLDESAAEFRWAARLEPAWSYAWFGAGSAELALAARLELGAESPRLESLARQAYSRGAQAFARALALEPSLTARLEVLARRALRDGRRERAIALREALEAFGGTTRPPERLLILGRVQRELGESGSIATFTAYLRSGHNRGLAQLELGRTQLSFGDPSGALRYLASASENDSATTAELRSDLALIAGDAELAEFDRRSGTARVDFLRRFWTGRDRLGLRGDGDRLVEHVRRLGIARVKYLVFGEDGLARLDDRGRVYLRHGDPDDLVSLAAPGVVPNESWRYRRDRRAGGPLVLHFVALHNPRDFRLVESVWDIPTGRTGRAQGQAASSLLPPERAELFRSRAALSPVYREAPTRRAQLRELEQRERMLGRRSMLLALASDAYPLHVPVGADLWGQVLVTGGGGTSAVLQVVFLAAPSFRALPRTARFRLIALDTAGHVVASADSNIALDSKGTGRLTIPVRPGRLITHTVLQLPQVGLDLGIDTVWVPAQGSGDLGLGTLLVGSDSGSVAVPLASGGEFPLATTNQFPRHSTLKLGAEVFGLAVAERVELQVLASPDSESGAARWRSIRLAEADRQATRDRSRGTIAMWRASIALRDLTPGRYRIAVIARTGAGRTARQEVRVEVGQR